MKTEFLPPFCPYEDCGNFRLAPRFPRSEFLSVGPGRFRCRRCGGAFTSGHFAANHGTLIPPAKPSREDLFRSKLTG